MKENRSIVLGDQYEEFVRDKVGEGKYKNANEVIEASLRLLMEEEQKMYELKNAIQNGIDSGIAVNFGPTMHLRELKKLKSLNE